MASIDDIIAGGAKTNANFDFGSINRSYWEGRDQAAKNDLRDAFKNGVPLTADGTPDFAAMAKTLYQKGGINEGNALIGAAVGPTERAKLDQVDSPTNPANLPPSASRTAGAVVAPPLNRGGAIAQGGPQAQPQGETPASFLQKNGIQPGYNMEVALAAFKRNGIEPDQPFNPNDPAISAKLGPIVQRLKGVGQVQPPQPGDNAPGQQPQQQPAPQQPQVVAPQPAPVQAQPVAQPAGRPAPQDDAILKRLTLLAASPDKATAEAARIRLKDYQERTSPTTEMKNAAASGMTLPEYQSAQSDQAATQAGAVETAKGYVAKYQAIDDAGTKAIQEIPKLQVALKQMESPDFYSGIGQNYNLALKRVAVALGGDPDKAAPQEIVSKVIADSVLNGLGALKGLGPVRVAEMKLASTAAMSPDNTPQSNRFLANVAIRIQQRAVEVSDMAQNYKDGVLDVGFDKKVREMDKNKPLFTPAEVQRIQNIIDGKEKAAPASTVPQFSSPADVHAAVAAGKLKSGDSFLDPNGKTRFIP
jgi:hypothetical protein